MDRLQEEHREICGPPTQMCARSSVVKTKPRVSNVGSSELYGLRLKYTAWLLRLDMLLVEASRER